MAEPAEPKILGSLNSFAADHGLDPSCPDTVQMYSGLLANLVPRPARVYPNLDFVLAGTVLPTEPMEEREQYQELTRR
jgi:hypothetical protein